MSINPLYIVRVLLFTLHGGVEYTLRANTVAEAIIFAQDQWREEARNKFGRWVTSADEWSTLIRATYATRNLWRDDPHWKGATGTITNPMLLNTEGDMFAGPLFYGREA